LIHTHIPSIKKPRIRPQLRLKGSQLLHGTCQAPLETFGKVLGAHRSCGQKWRSEVHRKTIGKWWFKDFLWWFNGI
jgi:hypothetical protein